MSTVVIRFSVLGRFVPRHWRGSFAPVRKRPVVGLPVGPRRCAAYDPRLTPTRGMGGVVGCFRHVPGAVRSCRPSDSFVAVWPNAAAIMEGHELTNGLGERSPLGRLYGLDASVLLLGVGHANNTSLHFAEYRSDNPKRWISQSAAVMVDGERTWVSWLEL